MKRIIYGIKIERRNFDIIAKNTSKTLYTCIILDPNHRQADSKHRLAHDPQEGVSNNGSKTIETT